MTETVESATAALLANVAETGFRWLQSTGDWRRELVGKLRIERFELMSINKIEGIKKGLAKKIQDKVVIPDSHFVVRPYGPADSEKWASTIGFEARANNDNEVQLGFFVAFFGKQQTSLDAYRLTSFGHRFDAPEGYKTTHNYFHVQPLKSWKNGATLPGAFQVQPDTFPTIPLDAADTLDLALHALHVACGAKFIEELTRTNSELVKQRARLLHRKLNPVKLHPDE
jgi:hypothetical protein